jgi:uncharacterized protein
MDSSPVDLFRNISFWTPVFAWLVAQFTKMLCGFSRTRRLDFWYLVSLGGMPSAHSAMASGLAVSLGLQVGFGSPLFVLAFAFACVVMFEPARAPCHAGPSTISRKPRIVSRRRRTAR